MARIPQLTEKLSPELRVQISEEILRAEHCLIRVDKEEPLFKNFKLYVC